MKITKIKDFFTNKEIFQKYELCLLEETENSLFLIRHEPSPTAISISSANRKDGSCFVAITTPETTCVIDNIISIGESDPNSQIKDEIVIEGINSKIQIGRRWNEDIDSNL